MISKLVLLANLFGLFLIKAFFLADLSITQNIPATMAPGSEVRVTVTVDKGELTGFAKLQIDLPNGMSATAIETKGASFTFAEGKAKFIWMSLPASPSFKVTYTLSADASVSGTQQIRGRLSYIENNERKTHELAPVTIDLGVGITPAIVTTGTIQVETEEPANMNDLVSAAGGAPVGQVPVVVIDDFAGTPAIQGTGGVSGTRVITPVTEKEMLVEVTVKKGDIRGFGKLQETIPPGFTALEKSSDEAIFTAQDRIVKFVWLNLPARNEVKVVYKLRANEKPDGEYVIDGEFGYLLNDETQKAVVGSSRFFIGAKALEMMTQDPVKVAPVENADAEQALRMKQEAERKAQEQASAQAAQREQEAQREREAQRKQTSEASAQRTGTATPKVSAPEKGVTYKVQITAAHREVGKAYFNARHRYTGAFSIERHQGWIKYVTGSFGEYREARDQRVRYVEAGHDFPGPFVTAYNNGERITVQEALLITKQQWVQ